MPTIIERDIIKFLDEILERLDRIERKVEEIEIGND